MTAGSRLPGLCSVTLRRWTAEAVVREAASMGVRGIEWGGDVHVPPGDLANAAAVARLCRDAGIEAPSYGSYLRLGAEDEGAELPAVLDTAAALGATNVRVWAGRTGSAAVTGEGFDRVADRLRTVAEAARPVGLAISVEYHRDTLTDTVASASRLLTAVNGGNVFSYWQPVPELGLATWLAELAALRGRLSHVHVFHWLKGNVRRPLAEAEADWRRLLAAAVPTPAFDRQAFALLEFVQDDSADRLRADMALLARLCAGPDEHATD